MRTEEELTAPLYEEIGRLKMDITYIPLQKGFMFLTAVIDWYSRYVLAWEFLNTKVLLGNQVLISMDGRGRALDNVFTERLWWSVKYEEVYPEDYADGQSLHHGRERCFEYYNHERNHSALDKKSPAEVFFK